ncbi:ATP-binding protein [Flavobacterium sp.]|jgi:serine/threonine-protein kinase RsbT|uniref:ATP-binding protein n=1 Tax=Flavobacterium sp. TaxID=239 RepID=UPI0037BF6538
MKLDFFIEGGDFAKVGIASSELKKTLKQLNVDPKIIRRTVVALYEAEINIVAHAYKGNITININSHQIDITLDDKGPGIPDVELAMKEGYSTATAKVREMGFGAGMGLANIRNNSDELKINSIVGEGTKVNIIINMS